MKNALWGHALLLASKMDSRTHARVMTRWGILLCRLFLATSCCLVSSWKHSDLQPLSQKAGECPLHRAAVPLARARWALFPGLAPLRAL